MGEVADLWTARLHLRQPTDADIGPIFDACQDPDIQRFTLVPAPYTRDDAEFFVQVVATADRSYVWVIRTRDSDEFVGVVGFKDGEQGAAIGYWCAVAQRGRGYLGEAVSAVIEHGFGALGIDPISWSALVDNSVSARLASAAGFRYTGRQIETVRGIGIDVHTALLRATDSREPCRWPDDVTGRG